MIINLTGQAGAGKSTIARELEKILNNPIVIDGDELREIFVNKDYSEDGRRKNITNAYNIARFLEVKEFTPIIALISPYEDLREDLKSTSEVKEIYIHTTQIRGRENYFAQNYSSPKSNFLDLSTDSDLQECIEKIIGYLNK
jgi:adenylylsulfate kinase-like enzyme